MLNCVCIYYVAKQKDCWDAGSYIEIPAIRLTADSWSQIITDIYNRPSPMRPYYYIHNLNQQQALPTDAKSIELGNIIVLFELTYDIVDIHDDVLLPYEDLVIKATKKLLNVINIKLDYSDYDFNISKLVYKILTSDKGIDHLEPAVPIIEGLIQIYKRDHYDKCEKYFKCLEFVLKIRLSFGKDE